MNNRGLGIAGAIIAMVIVGLIVSGIIYYGPSILSGTQKATEGTPGGVALYPGAVLNQPYVIMADWDNYWNSVLPAGWSAKNYDVLAEVADVQTVADWYKTNMSNWNLENEITENGNVYNSGHFENTVTSVRLVFTSGSDAALVQIYLYGHVTNVPALLVGGNGLLICSGPKTGLPYLTFLS